MAGGGPVGPQGLLLVDDLKPAQELRKALTGGESEHRSVDRIGSALLGPTHPLETVDTTDVRPGLAPVRLGDDGF
jgi:hypothetical protein